MSKSQKLPTNPFCFLHIDYFLLIIVDKWLLNLNYAIKNNIFNKILNALLVIINKKLNWLIFVDNCC